MLPQSRFSCRHLQALLLIGGFFLPDPASASRPPAAASRPPGRPSAVLTLGQTASLFLPSVDARLPWAAEVEKYFGSPALRQTSAPENAGLEQELLDALEGPSRGGPEEGLTERMKGLFRRLWNALKDSNWDEARRVLEEYDRLEKPAGLREEQEKARSLMDRVELLRLRMEQDFLLTALGSEPGSVGEDRILNALEDLLTRRLAEFLIQDPAPDDRTRRAANVQAAQIALSLAASGRYLGKPQEMGWMITGLPLLRELQAALLYHVWAVHVARVGEDLGLEAFLQRPDSVRALAYALLAATSPGAGGLQDLGFLRDTADPLLGFLPEWGRISRAPQRIDGHRRLLRGILSRYLWNRELKVAGRLSDGIVEEALKGSPKVLRRLAAIALRILAGVAEDRPTQRTLLRQAERLELEMREPSPPIRVQPIQDEVVLRPPQETPPGDPKIVPYASAFSAANARFRWFRFSGGGNYRGPFVKFLEVPEGRTVLVPAGSLQPGFRVVGLTETEDQAVVKVSVLPGGDFPVWEVEHPGGETIFQQSREELRVGRIHLEWVPEAGVQVSSASPTFRVYIEWLPEEIRLSPAARALQGWFLEQMGSAAVEKGVRNKWALLRASARKEVTLYSEKDGGIEIVRSRVSKKDRKAIVTAALPDGRWRYRALTDLLGPYHQRTGTVVFRRIKLENGAGVVSLYFHPLTDGGLQVWTEALSAGEIPWGSLVLAGVVAHLARFPKTPALGGLGPDSSFEELRAAVLENDEMEDPDQFLARFTATQRLLAGLGPGKEETLTFLLDRLRLNRPQQAEPSADLRREIIAGLIRAERKGGEAAVYSTSQRWKIEHAFWNLLTDVEDKDWGFERDDLSRLVLVQGLGHFILAPDGDGRRVSGWERDLRSVRVLLRELGGDEEESPWVRKMAWETDLALAHRILWGEEAPPLVELPALVGVSAGLEEAMEELLLNLSGLNDPALLRAALEEQGLTLQRMAEQLGESV